MEVLSFFMQMVVFAAVVYAVYEFYHGLQIFLKMREFINVLFVRPVVELFRSLARALLPYSKYLH